MATETTSIKPGDTFLDAVWDSIVTPGASAGLVATINGALIVQILVFVYLCMAGFYSVHILVMLGLSSGLLILFNWFIMLAPPATLQPATAESDDRAAETAQVAAEETPMEQKTPSRRPSTPALPAAHTSAPVPAATPAPAQAHAHAQPQNAETAEVPAPATQQQGQAAPTNELHAEPKEQQPAETAAADVPARSPAAIKPSPIRRRRD